MSRSHRAVRRRSTWHRRDPRTGRTVECHAQKSEWSVSGSATPAHRTGTPRKPRTRTAPRSPRASTRTRRPPMRTERVGGKVPIIRADKIPEKRTVRGKTYTFAETEIVNNPENTYFGAADKDISIAQRKTWFNDARKEAYNKTEGKAEQLRRQGYDTQVVEVRDDANNALFSVYKREKE